MVCRKKCWISRRQEISVIFLKPSRRTNRDQWLQGPISLTWWACSHCSFCWKVLHPLATQGVNALCWKEDASLALKGVSQDGKRRIFSFKRAPLEALTTEWSSGFRHKNAIHLQDVPPSVSQILLNWTSEIKHNSSLQSWFFYHP